MTYFIKTFGCQMNFSDSERMTTFLEKNGLKPSDDIAMADLVVFNTCGVRQTAENRVFGQTHNLRKKNKNAFIVVTGCVAHRKDVQRKMKDKVDLFIRTKDFFHLDISNILALDVQSVLKGECDYFDIQPKYEKKEIALVPIMTGCDNFCSYCVVPYARGREKSRTVEEIINEIDRISKNKYKEVVLLGQNVNSYRDKKTDFPALLKSLVAGFPKIKFRFITSHPKDLSDELIDVVAKHKNIPNEIHLPVQSGSDKVLRDMNRPYTQKHYLKLIEKIKKKIPKAKITTDVIVGFPTETEKEFRETVKVFKKVKFSDAYINKYSPRPETVALRLGDPIAWDEKKRREKVLRDLL